MVEMRETAEILAAGVAAQPRDPRRDRPRHQHLRRALDRLGRRRVPPRRRRRCGARTLFATHYHELADLARTQRARAQRALRGARVGRRRGLPAPARCRARRAAPTASRWRGWRACPAPVIAARARDPARPRGAASSMSGVAARRRGARRSIAARRARARLASRAASTPREREALDGPARARPRAHRRRSTRCSCSRACARGSREEGDVRRAPAACALLRARALRCLLGVDRPTGLGDVVDVRHWSYAGLHARRGRADAARAHGRRASCRPTSAAGRPERLYLDLAGVWVGRALCRRRLPVGDGLLAGRAPRTEYAHRDARRARPRALRPPPADPALGSGSGRDRRVSARRGERRGAPAPASARRQRDPGALGLGRLPVELRPVQTIVSTRATAGAIRVRSASAGCARRT